MNLSIPYPKCSQLVGVIGAVYLGLSQNKTVSRKISERMSATKNVKRLSLVISPLARSPNMIHPASAGAGELRPNVSRLQTRSRPQTPIIRDVNHLWPELGLHSPAKSFASAGSARTSRRGSVSVSPCPIENDESGYDEDVSNSEKLASTATSWIRIVTVLALSAVWLLFTVILMTQPIAETVVHLIAIPEHRTKSFWITELPAKNLLLVTLDGSFLPPFVKATPSTKHVTLWIELIEVSTTSLFIPNFPTAVREPGVISTTNISDAWSVPLTLDEVIDSTPQVRKQHIFNIYSNTTWPLSRFLLRIQMFATLNRTLAIAMSTDIYPIDPSNGLMYAALVLVGMYFLIIFELVHRTLAAMFASTMSVAILATFHERPSMPELISWIDIETLLLLFSMMILVAILSETGVFDYLAVVAYKMTGGRVWPLIFTLCIFTASLSSVLDNVTTVLLMTPVTIRLCEVLNLDPVPILISMIVYSNIGGALTPVGDPPNAIIASNPDIIKSGVDFGTFTLHMGIGVFMVGVIAFLQLRYVHYRHITDPNKKEPRDVQELRHEIAIWQRTASAMSSYTKNEVVVRETLLKKERRLTSELRQKIRSSSITANSFKANLEEMQAKYPIRNKSLLWKSGLTMSFVILFFFLHSVPGVHLSLGWTALLGAIFLLLIADNEDMEGVLGRVEWTTLLFFAALFVLMECLSRLGLITWIGAQTEAIIMSVNESNRLAVSLMLILWVSAIASAFIDNIPLTTMMIRIVTTLAKKPELGLPLQPLVWALAFGACLGGNGTLIGSSANVVGTGVAEQHGYKVTFIEFFKVGFPLMIVSICVISVYLLLAHVALTWH